MSDSQVIRHCCKIVNQHGLHTRSAVAIVELAEQFKSEIVLSSEKGESDASDMIRLMLLQATLGSEVCISASGIDAAEAVLSMTALIDAGFNE